MRKEVVLYSKIIQCMSKAKVKNSDWKNKLYYGDNLEVMRKYVGDESIDLCYIDPPFNSKRNYFQIYLNQGGEDKAQAQAFVDTWEWTPLAEKEYVEIINNYRNLCSNQTIQLVSGLFTVLGKSSLMSYLISMTLRLLEIHRILKKTGSFYLHCDPTASHYLKIICDSIFCSKGGDFRNEIVWHYRRWTNVQNQFQKMHDIILFYTKSENNIFNPTEIEMSESQKKKYKRGWDTNVIHTKQNKYSQAIVYDKIKFNDAVKIGRINLDKYRNIIYRDSPKVVASDVVLLPLLNSQAKERMGYQTQKPETLLDKIIEASTNKGDIVFDAYCGCGTTISSAQRLKRKWIGIDITFQSISVILRRLDKSFGVKFKETIDIFGVPKDFESAEALANNKNDKTRKEFEKWFILTFTENKGMINEKKGADGGIDGKALIMDYSDHLKAKTQLKSVILSVKSDKKPHRNYLTDLLGVMTRENAVMGYLLLLYEPTSEMKKEVNKMGTYHNLLSDRTYPRVSIITVKDLFNGKKIDLPPKSMSDVLKSSKEKDTPNTEQLKLFNEEEQLTEDNESFT